jgi:radical SAM superfamily enzyme YgiQ (UPF0313 family)
VDLAVSALPDTAIRDADAVAFYVPMHTATRLAAEAIQKVRELNPDAHLMAYGLYAPMNREYLRELGVRTIAGGEFEGILSEGGQGEVSMERLQFRIPDRSGLAGLERYARLRINGSGIVAGYTEASRGCKHHCRHCPVVPVYQGVFRVVQPDIVLADIRQQVRQGARHITFGDPDFYNGPRHGLRIAEAMHREFPEVTYDVTIKVSHLLEHQETLARLRETGCLFVTAAAESVDDRILEILNKGHTRKDFLEAVRVCREAGISLAPTFVAFTPWTTGEGYRELLRVIREEGLVSQAAPVQLALRLLVPAGSLLLEREEMKRHVVGWDKVRLQHVWRHPDPEMDELAGAALGLVYRALKQGFGREQIFRSVWRLAYGKAMPEDRDRLPRAAIPYLDEPWYC